MAQATRDSSGVAAKVHPRKPPLYATLAGYTDKRPAHLPIIDRAALMRSAHATARKFRQFYATYREALAYGLGAAWAQAKSNRNLQSLCAQAAPVQHTPKQIKASRAATRRAGSSLWAS
jgi:hypothetical protein